MVYVGLDLHKRYVTACALDADGRVLSEDRRLTTDIAVLRTWLGGLTGRVTVVLVRPTQPLGSVVEAIA
jgi:hypothetical protein